MKNVILGCLGTAIMLYMTLMVLSLYTVYVHQNELDRVLSRVMWTTMNDACRQAKSAFGGDEGGGLVDDVRIRRQLIENLSEALASHEDIGIQVRTCNMQAGILSAEVTERLPLPGGHTKTIRRSRTIILDRSEDGT